MVREQLTDRDLRLGFADSKNRDSGDFAEQVVIRGVLADGGTFYSKLTVANIANADGRADFSFDAKLADGRRANCKARKERGAWEHAADRLSATVGDGQVDIGVGRAVVTADCDGFKAVFTVETELPPLRPPGGLFEQGGAFYVTTLPIPRGKATLVIEPKEPLPRMAAKDTPASKSEPEAEPDEESEEPEEDGASESGEEGETDVIELEGIGYAEHRAGNLPPYRLAHAWYNVLEITEDETLIMSAFEKKHTADTPASDRGKARGWLVVVNDDGLVLYEPHLDVWVRGARTDEATKYSLPELIFVADEKREAFKGVIKPGTLTERKDDLAGLKRLERLVVRRFMKPWTFTYNNAGYLFRRQVPGEPMTEQRGTVRFRYQQLDE